jgi:hypothetical protein
MFKFMQKSAEPYFADRIILIPCYDQRVSSLPHTAKHERKPGYNWHFLMKCSFIALVIQVTFAGLLLASAVKGQNLNEVKVALNLNNATVKESLLQLQKNSAIKFTLFNQLLAQEDKKVTLTTTEISVSDALKKILAGTRLSYRLVNEFVVIEARAVPPKPGRISGKIVDEKGLPLPGASIRIIETGSGTMSAVDGTYALNLPPGTYTLEVSFVSFQTQRVTGVLIAEDKTTPLDVALQADAKGLKEVVITTGYKKASVAGLYAQQKNTSNLSDGISGDQIEATPDKHVGETLKRIAGVSTNENRKVVIRGIAERYNVSLLNGSSLPSTDVQERDFEFNLIPANLVENIVVAKSMTADMPYGFAGGLVQITTKSVPESNFFSINLGSSFNSRTTGKEFLGYGRGKYDYLGFDDGTRDHFPADLLNLVGKFDPTKDDSQNKIKVSEVAAQNKRIGGTERLGVRRFQSLPSQNYQLSLGRAYSLNADKVRKLGFVGSLSYRNTQTNDYVPNMRRGDWSHEPARGDDPADVNTGNIYGFNTTLGLMLNGGFKTEKHQINTYNLYTRIFDDRFSRYSGWTIENPKNDGD